MPITINIPATKDAQVCQDVPNTNFGSGQLGVGTVFDATVQHNTTNAWLYFDLSAVPANQQIYSASLNLFGYWINRSYYDTDFSIARSTASFTENSITWNNAPSVGSTITTWTFTGSNSAYKKLTPAIYGIGGFSSTISAASGSGFLVLRLGAGAGGLNFRQREYGTAATIDITYSTSSLTSLGKARDNISSGAVNLNPTTGSGVYSLATDYIVTSITLSSDNINPLIGQNGNVFIALHGGPRIAELQSSGRNNISIAYTNCSAYSGVTNSTFGVTFDQSTGAASVDVTWTDTFNGDTGATYNWTVSLP